MFRFNKDKYPKGCQSGQVLAEAVVVLLFLVVLVGAVQLSGRWQYQWLRQWLAAQYAADAVALDHQQLPGQANVHRADLNRWRSAVMREYSIGQASWQKITTDGQFAQSAWRLSGAGQASLDSTVTERIEQAPMLWRRTEIASKAVVYALMPTIKAVEAPWDDRGPATRWLRQWEGSTPPDYLNSRH